MRRVFAYAATVDTTACADSLRNVYIKYSLRVNRRNPILLAIPTMYAIAHGDQRAYIGEVFGKHIMNGSHADHFEETFKQTTIPHRRRTLTTLRKYLRPDIYGVTIADEIILSPFNKINRRYYSYRSIQEGDSLVRITFKPRLKNTQLVSGTAIADFLTGRIISAEFHGEYDMIRFTLRTEMGREGLASLLPQSCELDAVFRFLGNNISAKYYTQENPPPPSGELEEGLTQRPVPLSEDEDSLFQAHRKAEEEKRAAGTQKRDNSFKRIAWDMIGERIFNRTKAQFGTRDQGYLRISPILNPLYLGYSKRKGVYYKFDVRSSFQFNDNQEISTRLKAGYSFKQRQFYFKLPTLFYFHKRRNGYVELEIGNGNRITNSDIVEQVRHEHADSIKWENMNLDYFKDTYVRLSTHYDLSSRISLRTGIIVHHRDAVDKKGFKLAGKPHSYRSAAPLLTLEYRPTGYNGPILTFDYERSIKGFLKSNTGFERWEADGQYLYRLPRLRAVSMRVGAGFYTHKDDGAYSLDYTNFRDENIPGGWNDEWTGEFELLDRNWYNASEHYVRANLTYESPLLAMSWLPLVGRYIEMERIYVSALTVKHLHPYIECGYGFTTRLFSVALFLANKNGKFDGVGARLGFELFRQW